MDSLFVTFPEPEEDFRRQSGVSKVIIEDVHVLSAAEHLPFS